MRGAWYRRMYKCGFLGLIKSDMSSTPVARNSPPKTEGVNALPMVLTHDPLFRDVSTDTLSVLASV